MNRLKLPLMFVGIILMALFISSCSYAISGVEPNLTVGILAVNSGTDEYVAVTADMPINLIIAEENAITVRTSSSVFSPTITEKHNAVMNVVGSQWGRNPVIKGNEVAVSSVNSTDVVAILAERTIIRTDSRNSSIKVMGEADLLRGKSSVVKMPIYATITQIKARSSSYAIDVQVQSTNNDAFLTKCFAMHDNIRINTAEVSREGAIWGNKEVLKIPHDTIVCQLDSVRLTLVDTIKMMDQIDSICLSGVASYA